MIEKISIKYLSFIFAISCLILASTLYSQAGEETSTQTTGEEPSAQTTGEEPSTQTKDNSKIGIWEKTKEISKVIAPFGMLIIALSVAIIAYMQYHVNHERHRFELFNKRISIYRKLRSFLLNIIQIDDFLTEKTLKEIYRVFDETGFLFGDDITQYINEIREKTFSLNQKSLKLKSPNLSTDDIAPLKHDIDALKLEFDKQLEILQTKFSEYLKFNK